MPNSSMNVQDVYLNRLRRSQIKMKVHLIDGTVRQGQLIVFDQSCIVPLIDGSEVLIYKNNILAIGPAQPGLRVFTGDQPEWARNHVYGPEQTGEPPEGGLTLGERGTYRMPILQRPDQTYHPS